jgi:fructokinase
MSDEILCVGEILWDALPEGLFLGGAPFNVARHLHALGEDVAFVSRVGDDVLGQEALRRLRAQGLDASLVQIDDSLPTGFVRVALDHHTGEPDYEIVEPAAWDAIALTDALQRHAEEAAALVFGSLAQRASTSRQTIQRLCETDALRVFDINLRPPYVDRAVVEHSLRVADVVKLNDRELRQLQRWFDLAASPEDAMGDLATTFECRAVCVTWGGEGARLWQEGECSYHPSYTVAVEDTVGAGDAFLSALLSGLLAGRGGTSLLDCANRLGAYVASHSGALPAYEVEGLDDIGRLPLPEHPSAE